MAKVERTDPHRPGLIVPAHYEYRGSYAFGAQGIPPIGVQECMKVIQAGVTFKHPSWGFGLGKCSVCGAHFNYGDIWQHELSGELITIGHDCAEKYDLMYDRSAFMLELGKAKEARAIEIEKAKKAEAFKAFCAEHEGLAEAFEVEHKIIADIKAKLQRYGSISGKQIAFVLKLAEEVKNPPVEEDHVDAPEGKGIVFTGKVVSVKYHYDWDTTKMTVKVETPAGTWLAWGTRPKAMEGVERGDTVEIKATLKPGKDAYFARMSRPSGKVLEKVTAA